MGYHFSIRTVRLDIGRRFHFFGDDTSVSVVVRPNFNGNTKIVHTNTRTALRDGSPLRAEPATSVDVPTPTGGGWVNSDGEPVTAWSYTVTVTATGPGRTPVVWRDTINVPIGVRVVELDPGSMGQLTASTNVPAGTAIDPLTGGTANTGGDGGGTITVTEDPDVPGTALIGA